MIKYSFLKELLLQWFLNLYVFVKQRLIFKLKITKMIKIMCARTCTFLYILLINL